MAKRKRLFSLRPRRLGETLSSVRARVSNSGSRSRTKAAAMTLGLDHQHTAASFQMIGALRRTAQDHASKTAMPTSRRTSIFILEPLMLHLNRDELAKMDLHRTQQLV